jgi:hypothetical protein
LCPTQGRSPYHGESSCQRGDVEFHPKDATPASPESAAGCRGCTERRIARARPFAPR